MGSGEDERTLEQFVRVVQTLPFVYAIRTDNDTLRCRVWVITHDEDADQTMEIFGVQDDCDPEYRLDVKVRTRAQYDALAEVQQ